MPGWTPCICVAQTKANATQAYALRASCKCHGQAMPCPRHIPAKTCHANAMPQPCKAMSCHAVQAAKAIMSPAVTPCNLNAMFRKMCQMPLAISHMSCHAMPSAESCSSTFDGVRFEDFPRARHRHLAASRSLAARHHQRGCSLRALTMTPHTVHARNTPRLAESRICDKLAAASPD